MRWITTAAQKSSSRGSNTSTPNSSTSQRATVNTLPPFLDNLERAGLRDWVIPVISESARFAANWTGGGFGLVFIDGGHARRDVESRFSAMGTPCNAWRMAVFSRHLSQPGGWRPGAFEVFEAALTNAPMASRRPVRLSGSFATQMSATSHSTTALLSLPRRVPADSHAALRDRGPGWRPIYSRGRANAISLFGHVAARRPRPGARAAGTSEHFLANCAAISQRRRNSKARFAGLRYLSRRRRPAARDSARQRSRPIFRRVRFWPEHGVFLNGASISTISACRPPGASSVWQFRTVGAGLAEFDLANGTARRRRTSRRLGAVAQPRRRPSLRRSRHGADEYVYVFGSSRTGVQSTAWLA